MKVQAFAGETVRITVDVYDDDGSASDLTEASASMMFRRNEYDCNIASNSVIAELPISSTQVVGEFPYEIRVENDGDVRTVDNGTINIAPSLFK